MASLQNELIRVYGFDKLAKSVDRIAERESPKVARAAARGGAGELMKGIRGAIPKARTRGHSNRSTKKSLGRRTINKPSVFQVKIGFNVGRRKPGRNYAAHLVIMGTAARQTGTGANRGRIQNTGTVPRGVRSALPRAMEASRKAAAKTVARIKAK